MSGRSVIVLFVFLLLVAFAGLSALYPAYGEICEYPQHTQQKECTTYSLTPFFFIKITKGLDAMAAAITAIATGFIGYFTYTLWGVSRLAAQHTQTVERAYVRMSHKSDDEFPGLNPDNRKVRVEIKNTGQTPARVMGVRLGPLILDKDQPLPDDPPYLAAKMVDHPAAQAFLHAGNRFDVRQGLDIELLDWGAVTREVKTLYVIGLVEYIDVFGMWHRAGYARRYAHGRPKNNLTFVSEVAYSYDIVISESERLTGKQS